MAGYLVKPLLPLYGTEWRERGYGLSRNARNTMHASNRREATNGENVGN